jgi:hypothetical protein
VMLVTEQLPGPSGANKLTSTGVTVGEEEPDEHCAA